VEFLQATANPIDANIVGPKGRAAILREVAKGLAMPVDDIVPTDEEIVVQAEMQRQQELMMAQAGAGPQEVVVREGGGPEATGPGGAPTGGKGANTVSNQMTGGGGA
jgi:hypothetical protein